MTKYRVKKETSVGGEIKYSPQVKSWRWPFWVGLDWFSEYAMYRFDSSEEALKCIQDEVDKATKSTEYCAVYVKQETGAVYGGCRDEPLVREDAYPAVPDYIPPGKELPISVQEYNKMLEEKFGPPGSGGKCS